MKNSFVVPVKPTLGFDPQRVPVFGVDTHLPPVDVGSLQPSALRMRFANPPAWKPELLSEKRVVNLDLMHASVLIPIVMRDRPTVLLTERSIHLSNHSGQIAFPGGRADPSDRDATATALREAYEEVGLRTECIQVLGELPQYTTGSGFIITPVVALVTTDFTLLKNKFEVADIFEVPLDFLMNPANHRHHEFEWNGVRREWLSMHYEHQSKKRYIWGATAGILRNFYRMLLA